MRQQTAWLRPVISALVALGVFIPFQLYAATCDFTRDLELGVMGDDVLCLQKYLNTGGWQIASSGAGAPGKETGEYKALTEAAVIKWQKANNISPASGYFGAKSRMVYKSLVTGSPAPVANVNPANPSGNALIDELLAKINTLQTQAKPEQKPVTTPNPTVTKPTSSGLNAALRTLVEVMEDAKDEIEESDDTKAIKVAEENLDEAYENLLKGLREYLDGDETKAIKRFAEAEGWAEDAVAEVGGDSDKSEAQDLIAEVEDLIDEVEELIDEADADGEETSEAEDLLDEAKDLLDEAETAYDDGDYEDALALAEEAEDVANDAEDAIGEEGGSDVEDSLDEARDELDDAWESVEEAQDDGDDVGDAEDMLDEAEGLLDDAEEALDDDDEDEAEDLIDEALDLIEDALDEF